MGSNGTINVLSKYITNITFFSNETENNRCIMHGRVFIMIMSKCSLYRKLIIAI